MTASRPGAATAAHRDLPRTDQVERLPERALRALRVPSRTYMRRKWDIHQHGTEHVPASGPVILASNHIGWLDGPLLVVMAPRAPHAMTKSEMFEGRTGRLLHTTGQVAVVRQSLDVAAIRASVRALRDGQALAIYPEAKRGNGEFDRVKHGYAYLALVTGAPIVPVAIFGTRAAGESVSFVPPAGRRIDIVYGAPIDVTPQPWPRRRTEIAQTSHAVKKQLKRHLADATALTRRSLPGKPPQADPEGEIV